MKKGNLFLTLVFVAMAVLVGVGSMFATFAQAQNVALRVAAANEAIKLFDKNGNYAVERNTLTESNKGQIFEFFGEKWYLVNVNDSAEVATFWMVNPYGSKKYAFNAPAASAATGSQLFADGKTLWCNGYTKTEWNNVTVDESNLRVAMREIAKEIIDNASYKKYADKVVPGYVTGSNMDRQDDNAKMSIDNVYHAEAGTTSLYKITEPAQSMTAYYTLDITDRLWVPSTEEVRDSGKWGLSNKQRNFEDRTVDTLVWLRTPVDDHSAMAQLVGCDSSVPTTNGLVSQNQSFFKHYVDQEHGVRPAVHLSLRSFSENNSNNGGWFTDDMMKVFFIIICVLGVIGVILVIIAVVAKARRDKQANEQNA